MLKAHQAVIDLEKNCLRIQGREVQFLAEHELPDKARGEPTIEDGPTLSTPAPSNPPQSNPFPGSGARLGQSSTAPPPARPVPPAASRNTGGFSESSIRTLMDLGASREEAIRVLEAAGGNVDYAASMLF